MFELFETIRLIQPFRTYVKFVKLHEKDLFLTVITKVLFGHLKLISLIALEKWTILFLRYQVQLTKLISKFRMPIYVH